MSKRASEPTIPARAVPEAGRDHAARRCRRIGVAVLASVVLAVGLTIAVTSPFAGSGGGGGGGVTDSAYPTASVRQGPLSSYTEETGTLAYAADPDGSPYSVVNRAHGTLTALPSPGRVIRQGEALYRVTNHPVVLLEGSTPASRPLSLGDSGPDVRELNVDLVALGYAKRSQLDPTSEQFTSATASALSRLQAKVGVPQTGSLPLGQAVFLPAPVRITKVLATLGTIARPGAPVAQATSIRRQVEVNLDAAGQSTVKVGHKALITLPSNRITRGVVSRIGTVATSSKGGSSSGSSGATVPLYITLDRPRLAGNLDHAPVQVEIQTLSVTRALSVPVTALLAQAGGGYAVETVDARGVRHLVPVRLGLFDVKVGGRVEVSGPLHAGARVVVPRT